jgi:hypothetical protein
VISPAPGASSAADLPDYAPIPPSAVGSALNDQGYYVGRVERNLYWFTDGTNQSEFPDRLGRRRAVRRRCLSRRAREDPAAAAVHDDPARPTPAVTCADRYSLEVAGERAGLASHGPNHSPGLGPSHCPNVDTLHLRAPRQARHRDDVSAHQQYNDEIEASAREAVATVDPTPYFAKYRQDVWAAVRTYLDELINRAATPVIAKYTGVLPAATVEVFTTTTFTSLQSTSLDLGPSSPLHP